MNAMLVILADVLKVAIPLIGITVVTWQKIWEPQSTGRASKGGDAIPKDSGNLQDPALLDEQNIFLTRLHWKKLSKRKFPAWDVALFGILMIMSALMVIVGARMEETGLLFSGLAYLVISSAFLFATIYRVTNSRAAYVLRNAPTYTRLSPKMNARLRDNRDKLIYKEVRSALKISRRHAKRGNINYSTRLLDEVSVACVALSARGIVLVRNADLHIWGVPLGRPIPNDRSLQDAAKRIFEDSFGVRLTLVCAHPVGYHVDDSQTSRGRLIVGFAMDADGVPNGDLDKLLSDDGVKFVDPSSTDLTPFEADFVRAAKEARGWKRSRAAAS